MADRSASKAAGDTQCKQVPRAERVKVRFQTRFGSKSVSGTGMVQNISPTGALVEPGTPKLEPPATLQITLPFLGRSFDVEAEVVRKTDKGFAIRFVRLDALVHSVLKLISEDSAFEDADETLLDVAQARTKAKSRAKKRR